MEKWARDFWERRKREEEHSIDHFYVYGKRRTLLQVVATNYVGNEYYMKTDELITHSIPLHFDVLQEDDEFHIALLKTMREVAFTKDQILLGIASYSRPSLQHPQTPYQYFKKHYHELVQLLATFPPNLLYRYILLLRATKPLTGKGFGHKEKRLVGDVIESWSIPQLEYYAMRYHNALVRIANLAHPSFENSEVEKVFKYAIAKRRTKHPAPTWRLVKYQEALKAISEKNYDKALSLIAEHRLPFEMIRNSMGAKSEFHRDLFYEAVKNTIPAGALLLNLRYFINVMGTERTARLVRDVLRGGGKVTPYEIARAMFAINHEDVREALSEKFELYSNKVLDMIMPELDINKAVLCLDASGSMSFRLIRNALAIAGGMRPLLHDEIVIFDTKAGVHELWKDTKTMIAEETVNSIINAYDGGTNIQLGVETAVKVARGAGLNTIILVTDEQENVARGYEEVSEALPKDMRMIVVNPSPYPSHAVSPKDPRIIHVPAGTINNMLASLRLLQIQSLKEEEVAKYVLKLVKKKT